MTKHISSINLMIIRVDERLARATAIAAAGRRIAQFVKQLAKAFRQRRQIAAVAALDDRTLKDIGLTRGKIQDVTSQQFWAFKPLDTKHWRWPADRNLDTLARLDDSHLCNLSETGQRLRREARRPR